MEGIGSIGSITCFAVTRYNHREALKTFLRIEKCRIGRYRDYEGSERLP